VVGDSPAVSPPCELHQALGEVARRDPLQVHPRDQLLDGLRSPQVRRQDLAREPELLTGLVDTAIIDTWLLDLDCSDPGLDRAGPVVAITHDQAMAVGIALVRVVVDVGCDFFPNRSRQHLLRTRTQDFIEDVLRGRPWTWDGFFRSFSHVTYLPFGGFVVNLTSTKVRRASHPVIHNIRFYVSEGSP